jgi:hypothetical protein
MSVYRLPGHRPDYRKAVASMPAPRNRGAAETPVRYDFDGACVIDGCDEEPYGRTTRLPPWTGGVLVAAIVGLIGLGFLVSLRDHSHHRIRKAEARTSASLPDAPRSGR